MAGFEFFPNLYTKRTNASAFPCYLKTALCAYCHSTQMDSDEPTPDAIGEIQGDRTRVKLRMLTL